MGAQERVAVLAGCGGWLPPRIVGNEELGARLDVSAEWIRARTGIERRRLAEAGTTTADLAVRAGELALKSAGCAAVGALIVATTSADRPFPGAAAEVAARLNLGRIAAFDVAAASSGFIYGLATASGLISAGVADRVLLIAAEMFSPLVDPFDPATAMLFGDGAGAVVVRAGEAGEPGAIGPFDLGSDGTLAEVLCMPRLPQRPWPGNGPEPAAGRYMRMDGPKVFRQAVDQMAASARRVLAAAGWSVTGLDQLICHQANQRIQRALAARLRVAPERSWSNIAEVGNTQAASIPLLLAQAAARGHLKPGQRVLLTAFGAGLTWGSALLTWPALDAVTN
jgi:3-oxoacyl-[acyl-carrier-protein] synthase III